MKAQEVTNKKGLEMGGRGGREENREWRQSYHSASQQLLFLRPLYTRKIDIQFVGK